MVNPGSFLGSRHQFLTDQQELYTIAVKENHVADTVADIQRRYFKHYPVTIPHAEEPTAEFLAFVDDNSPDPELAPPKAEGLTDDEYARAKCRLQYEYNKMQNEKLTVSLTDPMAILMAKLMGTSIRKPRLKTPFNVWGSQNREIVDPIFLERVAIKNIPAKQHAMLRSSIYKELFGLLAESEQQHWIELTKQQYQDDLNKVETILKSGPLTLPEDQQRVIEGLPKFVMLILDLIGAYTGWKVTLIAGGPEPADGGRLNVVSVHSGTTSGTTKMTFGRSERKAYKDQIVPAFGKFLGKCYTVQDCRNSALSDQSDFVGLVESNEHPHIEVHSIELMKHNDSEQFVKLAAPRAVTTTSPSTSLKDATPVLTPGIKIGPPKRKAPVAPVQSATPTPTTAPETAVSTVTVPVTTAMTTTVSTTTAPTTEEASHIPAPATLPSHAPSPAPVPCNSTLVKLPAVPTMTLPPATAMTTTTSATAAPTTGETSHTAAPATSHAPSLATVPCNSTLVKLQLPAPQTDVEPEAVQCASCAPTPQVSRPLTPTPDNAILHSNTVPNVAPTASPSVEPTISASVPRSTDSEEAGSAATVTTSLLTLPAVDTTTAPCTVTPIAPSLSNTALMPINVSSNPRPSGAATVPDINVPVVPEPSKKGRKWKGTVIASESGSKRTRSSTSTGNALTKRKLPNENAAPNQKKAARSAAKGTIAAPPNCPPWVSNIVDMFNSMDQGPEWESIISKWLIFEQNAHFTGTANLGTEQRPRAIADWIRRARSSTFRPDINLAQYKSDFTSWWRSLQPEWRTIEGSENLL